MESPAPVADSPAMEIHEIGLARLAPGKGNRKVTKESVEELAANIRAVGLLHPLTVRFSDDPDSDSYVVVSGHRRLVALRSIGATHAPCVIVDPGPAGVVAVSENIQRVALSPLEEARAVDRLLREGGDIEEVAAALGKTRAFVASRRSLLALSKEWMEKIETCVPGWGVGHMALVARYPAAVQADLLDSLRWPVENGSAARWSVETLAEELRKRVENNLDRAPFDLAGGKPSCVGCPKRSTATPDMFAALEGREETGEGTCLDAACFKAKVRAHADRVFAKLVTDHPDKRIVWAYDLSEPGMPEGALSVHSLEKAPKGVAELGFVLCTGPKAGSIGWANDPRKKLAKKTGDSTASASSSPEEGSTELDESVATKKARADERRVVAFCRMIVAAMRSEDLRENEAITHGDILSKLAALSYFGLAKDMAPLSHRGVELEWDAFRSRWETACGREPAPGSEPFDELAIDVICRILRKLSTRLDTGNVETRGDAMTEALRWAELLCLDVGETMRIVASEIPYGKAWRGKVTDNWAEPDESDEPDTEPESEPESEPETEPKKPKKAAGKPKKASKASKPKKAAGKPKKAAGKPKKASKAVGKPKKKPVE